MIGWQLYRLLESALGTRTILNCGVGTRWKYFTCKRVFYNMDTLFNTYLYLTILCVGWVQYHNLSIHLHSVHSELNDDSPIWDNWEATDFRTISLRLSGGVWMHNRHASMQVRSVISTGGINHIKSPVYYCGVVNKIQRGRMVQLYKIK